MYQYIRNTRAEILQTRTLSAEWFIPNYEEWLDISARTDPLISPSVADPNNKIRRGVYDPTQGKIRLIDYCGHPGA